MSGDEQEKKKKKKEHIPHAPIKTTTDYMKMKLDKLMSNMDKPVVIPDRPKEKNGPSVPEFVRNVMGSSAGAGSGEFHVYRHLRRKEYARQKFIQKKSEAEEKDEEFQKKLEENAKKAKEATEKKRAKRLKRKQRKKVKKTEGGDEKSEKIEKSESDDSESDN